MSDEQLDVLLVAERARKGQSVATVNLHPPPKKNSTDHFDELEELDDGRVEEVVSSAVVQQGIDDRLKQVPFDDVAVVVLVLQADDPAHEAQSTWQREKRFFKKDSKLTSLTGLTERQTSKSQIIWTLDCEIIIVTVTGLLLKNLQL